MKKLLLTAVSILLSGVTVLSQEHSCNYANSDSPDSFQVHCQPSPATNYKEIAATTRKQPVFMQPPQVADKAVVKKTAMVTMTVYDGYEQREAPALVKATAMVKSTATVMAAGTYLKGYTTGNQFIDSYIVDSCRRYRIDPLLIYSQMNQESSFKVRATSNKGASGLMQLMPATARRMGVTNIYDPQQNIEGGVKYMRLLLDMFNGDLDLALAGYNAGEGAVIKYGYQIPPYAETQDYVKRISNRYRSISYTNVADQKRTAR